MGWVLSTEMGGCKLQLGFRLLSRQGTLGMSLSAVDIYRRPAMQHQHCLSYIKCSGEPGLFQFEKSQDLCTQLTIHFSVL